MIDQEKIKQAVRLLLEGIGEDISREGLLDTPPASIICSLLWGTLILLTYPKKVK